MQGGKPYSNSRFPYVRPIMNSKASFNWIKKAAQTGLSEAAITISLYAAIRDSLNVLYYFPTKAKMDEFSAARVDDAIVLSPYINGLTTTKNRSMKRFGTSTVYMLGANLEGNDLKSTSGARMIMDEFDEWSKEAVALALERMSGQVDIDTRVWGFSTPTLPDVGVDEKFKESTQESFFFPCPHCAKPIALEWDLEEETGRHCLVMPDNKAVGAHYQCWRCNGELPDDRKAEWLAGGFYAGGLCKNGNPVDVSDTPNFKLNRGFYVPQMYSPGVTATQFAVKYLRGAAGDLAALREFYNSGVGSPFLEGKHRVEVAHLKHAKQIAPYYLASCKPKKGDVITLGIDQGGPVHHFTAVEWKFDLDRYGDPNDRAIGKIIGLGRIMADDWDRVYGLMREYRVRMCVIDYFPEPTNARKFARRFPEFVYLCQYPNGVTGIREVRTTEDEYGANLAKVDKTAWLSKSLGRIISGDLMLPIDTPEEFEEHVRAPIRTMNKDRVKAEFVIEAPDHYAHALNYAEVALKILDPPLHQSNVITR